MSSKPHISRTKTSKSLDTPREEPTKAQSLEEIRQRVQFLTRERNYFVGLLILFEIFILLVYGTCFNYPADPSGSLDVYRYFPDINVMIFFGFGFLMTFLRRYAYSAIGYTLLISSMVVQWSIVLEGMFKAIANETPFAESEMGVLELLNGLFCSGAVMISYGAVLGKVTPVQLLLMGFLEPIFFWINVYVNIMVLKAIDVGGGMTIHTLGAYFGLAVTTLLTSAQTKGHKDNCSNYASDTFSLAGTIFLWIMWPSFNAAISITPHGQMRAMVNTFISLTGSVLGSFMMSRLLSERRFDVVHIQNSTLAGGVAMGVVGDLILTPVGVLGCGLVVGAISVWGYKVLTPWLNNRWNIQDVCGVHNLHGMPGVVSAIIGIFATLGAANYKDQITYEDKWDSYFPQGGNQAAYQFAALGITLGLSLAGGIFTGVVLKLARKIYPLSAAEYYNDDAFWGSPSDYGLVVDDPASETVIASQYGYEMKEKTQSPQVKKPKSPKSKKKAVEPALSQSSDDDEELKPKDSSHSESDEEEKKPKKKKKKSKKKVSDDESD